MKPEFYRITLEELEVLRKAASKAQSIYAKALRAYKRRQRDLNRIQKTLDEIGKRLRDDP